MLVLLLEIKEEKIPIINGPGYLKCDLCGRKSKPVKLFPTPYLEHSEDKYGYWTVYREGNFVICSKCYVSLHKKLSSIKRKIDNTIEQIKDEIGDDAYIIMLDIMTNKDMERGGKLPENPTWEQICEDTDDETHETVHITTSNLEKFLKLINPSDLGKFFDEVNDRKKRKKKKRRR